MEVLRDVWPDSKYHDLDLECWAYYLSVDSRGLGTPCFRILVEVKVTDSLGETVKRAFSTDLIAVIVELRKPVSA